MLEVTIKIKAHGWTDVYNTLGEVRRLIDNGHIEGSDYNESMDASYEFEGTGYDEDLDEEDDDA